MNANTAWNAQRRAETARILHVLYARAFAHFGPRHWWPGSTREEVVLGAVLTQNTSWSNVEKALESLGRESPLTLRAVAEMETERLAHCIRPVGYFTLKARRLQAVARWFLERCGPPPPDANERGSVPGKTTRKATEPPATATASPATASPAAASPVCDPARSAPVPPRRRFDETGRTVDLAPLVGLTGLPLESLRRELLGVIGIGPETADSILLYALDAPTFVVDAYTLRIGHRHGLFPSAIAYEDAKLIFEGLLGRDVDWFNEYHAQIVALGKHYCKTKAPLCDRCPLGDETCFAFGRSKPVRPPARAIASALPEPLDEKQSPNRRNRIR